MSDKTTDITDRPINEGDRELLELSLSRDEHHKGTKADFFYQYGTVCNAYEDDKGPICWVRGSKALRLDIQYNSNADIRRNMKAMLSGFDKLAEKARENGFREVIFNTNSPLLAKFCIKAFGFVQSGTELRKLI